MSTLQFPAQTWHNNTYLVFPAGLQLNCTVQYNCMSCNVFCRAGWSRLVPAGWYAVCLNSGEHIHVLHTLLEATFPRVSTTPKLGHNPHGIHSGNASSRIINIKDRSTLTKLLSPLKTDKCVLQLLQKPLFHICHLLQCFADLATATASMAHHRLWYKHSTYVQV